MRLTSIHRPKSDYVYGLMVLILALFGLVMISSASAVVSYERFNSNYAFVWRHLGSIGLGIAAWIAALAIDYRIWQRYALHILGFSLVLLIIVLFQSPTLSGAQRWIFLGPISIQPSEFVKLATVIFFAAWLPARVKQAPNPLTGFIPFIVALGLIMGLVLLQPDMGTAMVIGAIGITLYFAAGAHPSMLAALFGIGSLGVIGLVLSADYRLQRFLTFLNPSAETLGAGYHINQALLGIGSGGLFGLGFGQSRQKYLYLPQPFTDSIFSIVGEELGFIRAVFVILAFVWLGLRGLKIAARVRDPFGQLVVIGVTAWISFQAFVNIAAMLGLLPLTGIPLPFVSFGGSAMIALLFAVGLVMNISRNSPPS